MNNLQSILTGISNGFTAKKTPQITKESTQAPAIKWDSRSPGTSIPFEQPIPTAFGSDKPYEMMPQNATHFLQYFADQQLAKVDPFKNRFVVPNPANILVALATPQHMATDGNPDIWQKHWEIMNARQKGYNPVGSLR